MSRPGSPGSGSRTPAVCGCFSLARAARCATVAAVARKKKNPRPNPPVAPPPDLGTLELRRRHRVVVEGQGRHARARNLTGCPLDYYRSHGLLTEPQYDAGTRLYRDFYQAGLPPKTTLDLATGTRVPNHSLIPRQLAAEEEYRQAVACLAPACRRIVTHVCCLEQFTCTYRKRYRGRKLHSAMSLLREGLSVLAVHYGFLRRW